MHQKIVVKYIVDNMYDAILITEVKITVQTF